MLQTDRMVPVPSFDAPGASFHARRPQMREFTVSYSLQGGNLDLPCRLAPNSVLRTAQINSKPCHHQTRALRALRPQIRLARDSTTAAFRESQDYTRPRSGNLAGNCCQSVAWDGHRRTQIARSYGLLPRCRAEIRDGRGSCLGTGVRQRAAQATAIWPSARCAEGSVRERMLFWARIGGRLPLHPQGWRVSSLYAFFANLRPLSARVPSAHIEQPRAFRHCETRGLP